jgi:hypothetical protein
MLKAKAVKRMFPARPEQESRPSQQHYIVDPVATTNSQQSTLLIKTVVNCCFQSNIFFCVKHDNKSHDAG